FCGGDAGFCFPFCFSCGGVPFGGSGASPTGCSMSGRNRVFRPAPLVKKPFSFFSRSGFFRCPPSWEPSPSERGGRYGCFLPVGRSPMLPFSCFSAWPLIFSAGRERAALQGSCWDMKGPAFTGKPADPLLSFLGKQERDFFSVKDRQHSLSVLFKDVQSPHLIHLLPSPPFDFLKILPKLLSAEGRPDFIKGPSFACMGFLHSFASGRNRKIGIHLRRFQGQRR